MVTNCTGQDPELPARHQQNLTKVCRRAALKKRMGEATIVVAPCWGYGRAPPVALKGRSWWLRGVGLRGVGVGSVLPPVPDKGPCPPQEGAEMQSKLPAPFLSLGGIWKCKALNTNCLNWTYVNLF